jgi:NADH-quinone oxidoreductase subunit J
VSASRLAFDLAGGAALFFAAVMVLHRHPVKSLLSAVVSFFMIAAEFVLLSAPFLGVIQVIVYAGAILVLFLFVTMLLNLDKEPATADRRPVQKILAVGGIAAFGWLLLAAVGASGGAVPSGRPLGGPEVVPLARALFSETALPFEAVSILLLASLVGAFILMRKEPR